MRISVVGAPLLLCASLVGACPAALTGLLIAADFASAQTVPAALPATVHGTLHRIWGDPLPGQPGLPRSVVEIHAPDGGGVTTVTVPSDVADAHGGIQSLVGRMVTVTLAPRTAQPSLAGPLAPPVVQELETIGGRPQPYAPNEGLQRWVVIPCRFADDATTPVSVEYLQQLLGDGPASMGEYWTEASYGKVALDEQVLAWRSMPRPRSAYVFDSNGDGGEDPAFTLLAGDCLDTADAEIDFSTVSGVLLVFNGSLGCCAWGGSTFITRDGVSKAIGATWLPARFGTQHGILAHEMGHAFGLAHLNDVGSVGVRWDVMASGSTCSPSLPVGCRGVHISAPQKDQLGWIPSGRRFLPPPDSTETVVLESLALPPSAGAYLAAVVPTASGELVVESRWRRSYDAGVPGDAVVIYRVDPSRTERVAVVDVDGNADRNDEGAMWRPGETFTDPASGVVVRVDAVTTLGHVVTVTRPAAAPPPNTTCATAQVVTQTPFRVVVSTELLGDAVGLPHSECAPVPSRGLWYSFTAPADGLVSVTTNGSRPAATASAWLGVCGRLGIGGGKACNAGSSTLSASTSHYAMSGQTVYVVVTIEGAQTGTLGLQLHFFPSPRSGCMTSLMPSPSTLPVAGGTVTMNVQAPAGCKWSLFESVDWITPVGATFGTGNGTATFAVSANTGPGRAHPFWVANYFVPVTQDGCAAGDDDCDGMQTSWEKTFGLDAFDATGEQGAAGDPDGDGLTNIEESDAQSHPRGIVTRYFAEGATGAFFNTRLALANPLAQRVSAVLRFLTGAGLAGSVPVVLEPQQRRSINPEAVPGLGSSEFATIIESDAPIVADRMMQWGGVGYGSHAETAISEPSRTWFLAEGSTVGPFVLFYLLQNSNPTETAVVHVRYLLPDGPPLDKVYTIAPSSRFNIWVDEELFDTRGRLLQSTDVSAAIEVIAGPPIIVERAMYLSRGGETFSAGHESAGVAAAATTWFLAEGATGAYFDEFVLIANPGDQVATVEVRYLLPDGTVHTVTHRVPAASRYNIWVDEEQIPGKGKVLADTAVSVTLRSVDDVPIVVERAMWWPRDSTAWMEAHNSPGATSSGTRWGLAEGEVGGPANTDTYILVANVSTAPAQVRVTLLFEDASTATRDFVVAPDRRFNVWVREEFPEARGRRFGAIVESRGSTPAQLVVERAMYGDALGVPWASGTNALAVRLAP
jgi:M6 family metalloprotease-like protein